MITSDLMGANQQKGGQVKLSIFKSKNLPPSEGKARLASRRRLQTGLVPCLQQQSYAKQGVLLISDSERTLGASSLPDTCNICLKTCYLVPIDFKCANGSSKKYLSGQHSCCWELCRAKPRQQEALTSTLVPEECGCWAPRWAAASSASPSR